MGRPLLHHTAGQFFQKERIAIAFGDDLVQQHGGYLRGRQQGVHHLGTVVGCQPRQCHLCGIGCAHPRGMIPRPERHQEEDAGPCQPLCQCCQPGCRGGVGPVEIFDLDDERALSTALQLTCARTANVLA